MKKLLIILISFSVLLSALILPVSAALYTPTDLKAESVYMVCLDNGAVVCDINSRQKASPASITKIVTAILTIENCTDFEHIVTVPSYCIRLLDGTNSSTAGILVGEELSVKDLLYCLLVCSANDAANILADYIGGGDMDKFIAMMNDFVVGLGCQNTHFVNAHGLDHPDHYSTAYDLSVIYTYCLKNSMFAEIAGTFKYDIPPTNKYESTRYMRNTNGLLNPGISDYYFEYAKNGKTGTTDNAGRCLISSASKDGYNYLCVVLGGQFYDIDEDGVEENLAIIESKNLYKWAFDNLKIREVTNPSTYVCEAKVRLSKEYDYVSLVPKDTITALVPYGVNAENVFIEPDSELTVDILDAPVKQGTVLGRAAVKYAGQTIDEVDLVAAFDVNRSTVLYIKDVLSKTFDNPIVKLVLLVVLIVGLPACIVFFVVIPSKRRAKKKAVRVVKSSDIHERKK